MNLKRIFGMEQRIFMALLLLWLNRRSAVCAADDFDSLESGEISPPLRNSGVGDRQSAFRRILHDQLEQLTHVVLKQEEETSEEPKDYIKDEVERTNDENTDVKATQGNGADVKRTFDEDNEEDHAEEGDNNEDGGEEVQQAQAVYNPWRDSFQDIFDDGSYVFGHNLPNGVTRYERSFYSEKYKGRVVQGFYTQPRHYGHRLVYELRCYRSDYYHGYQAFPVQYLRRQPIVQRDTEPDVDCLYKH